MLWGHADDRTGEQVLPRLLLSESVTGSKDAALYLSYCLVVKVKQPTKKNSLRVEG